MMQDCRIGQLPQLDRGEVQLCAFPLTADARDMPVLHAILDEDERRRADRFRFRHDRDAFIVAHAMVRLVLGHHCRCAADAIVIQAEPGRKPRLVASGDLHFSLSHSGPAGLLGVTDRPIGVDLEHVRTIPDLDGLVSRFFHDSEVKHLLALPGADRPDAFFAHWVAKEAFLKAIGLGLGLPLAAFAVRADPHGAQLLSGPAEFGSADLWSIWSARIDDFWMAAAVVGPHPRFRSYRLAPFREIYRPQPCTTDYLPIFSN